MVWFLLWLSSHLFIDYICVARCQNLITLVFHLWYCFLFFQTSLLYVFEGNLIAIDSPSTFCIVSPLSLPSGERNCINDFYLWIYCTKITRIYNR